MAKKIPLPRLAAHLREHGARTTYASLYRLATNGELPFVEVSASGRWWVPSDRLEEIAAAINARLAA